MEWARRLARRVLPVRGQSQHGEDEYIAALLEPETPRYVVDVGANDGFAWSNSYFFIRRGFSALLIEPMPRYAALCRYRYRRNRKVVVEEAAVLDYEGRTKFFISDNPSSDYLAMRSSVHEKYVVNDGRKSHEVDVACAPLSTLLARHGAPRSYAMLSIDAEGADLKVLETADLSTYSPQVICIEYGFDEAAIHGFLESQGYARRTTLGPNGIYVRSG